MPGGQRVQVYTTIIVVAIERQFRGKIVLLPCCSDGSRRWTSSDRLG